MEGKPDPAIKNYLHRTWTLGQRVEAEATMRSLVEHEGWALMEELVNAGRSNGFENLAANGIKEQAEYASKLGVLNGMTFHRDVVASVIDSAKNAAAELKKSAALAEAAERS